MKYKAGINKVVLSLLTFIDSLWASIDDIKYMTIPEIVKILEKNITSRYMESLKGYWKSTVVKQK